MRPYLRAANVGWSGLLLGDVNEMNFTDAEMSVYRLEPDDIVLGEASGSPDEVGKPAIWAGQIRDCAFQNTLLRVRCHSAEPRYLLYFFRHLALSQAFARRSRGVGIHHIGRAALASWRVPLPSLAEQRRIVGVLEDHLSRLDAANADLNTAVLRTQAFAASVMETLVREATRTGVCTPLSELAGDARYGTSTKCVVDGPGAAVVRIPNLMGGQIDLADEKRVADPSVDVTSSMLEPDDLLFVRTNGSHDLIGRTAVVQRGINAAFASYLIRYRFKPSLVRSAWVHLVCQAPSTRRLLESMAASSAGQYNLSLGKLDSVVIPVPSMEEQDRLLAQGGTAVRRAGLLASEVRAAADRSASLERSLLSRAFSDRL
jgi:type I restriction enzyme S subunit